MPYTISQLICPKCNHVIPIPRKMSYARKKGHIKDVYCPWCNKVQHTIEYQTNEPIKNLDGEILNY